MRTLIHRHVSVRTEGMVLAAALWCLFGVGALVSATPDPPGSVLHAILMPWGRAALWIGTALAATVTAPFVRGSNRGLGLLIVAPALHLLSYLWAWLVELIPGPPPGDPLGWYRATFYFMLVMFVILLSHIPANIRPPLTGRST